MILVGVKPDVLRGCIPRESGDDPVGETGQLLGDVYSPRERG